MPARGGKHDAVGVIGTDPTIGISCEIDGRASAVSFDPSDNEMYCFSG